MSKIKFRNLRADEIQCRVKGVEVDQMGRFFCRVLLYKDARVDQNILDETVGPENWSKEHRSEGGQIFCRIGIKTDEGWVYKEDTGSSDNNFEQEKSRVSDSFKRAGFVWGIGRALYTHPDILFYLNDCEVEKGQKIDRFFTKRYINFFVKEGSLKYSEDGTKITDFIIVDQNNCERFNTAKTRENTKK